MDGTVCVFMSLCIHLYVWHCVDVCVALCVCVGVGVGEIWMGLFLFLYSSIFEKNPKHTDRLAFMLL